MIKKMIASISILLFLAVNTGCSTKAKNVSASYVSPVQYQGYNCNQIRQDLLRVNQRVLEVTGKQDAAATKDAVALGVGLVLFWPALFFMIGGDKKEELGLLKGEYEALQTAAIDKECNVAAEIQEAKRQKQEYEESTRIKGDNDVVEDEHKRLNQKLEYYTSQNCIDDMIESKEANASGVEFKCADIANRYKEKIELLKENPDGYFYKKAMEKNDPNIMTSYQKSIGNES